MTGNEHLRAEAIARAAWCGRLIELVRILGRDRQPSEYQLDMARAAIREYDAAYPPLEQRAAELADELEDGERNDDHGIEVKP